MGGPSSDLLGTAALRRHVSQPGRCQVCNTTVHCSPRLATEPASGEASTTTLHQKAPPTFGIESYVHCAYLGLQGRDRVRTYWRFTGSVARGVGHGAAWQRDANSKRDLELEGPVGPNAKAGCQIVLGGPIAQQLQMLLHLVTKGDLVPCRLEGVNQQAFDEGATSELRCTRPLVLAPMRPADAELLAKLADLLDRLCKGRG